METYQAELDGRRSQAEAWERDKNCLQEWLNQKVDLVTYAALKSPLKEQILKEVIDVTYE